MIALWSPSLGALALSESEHNDAAVRFVGQLAEQPGAERLLAFAADWRRLDSVQLDENVLRDLNREHAVSEAASYLRYLILDGNDDLHAELFAVIEELLQTTAEAKEVLSLFLTAPLRRPEIVDELSASALAQGFGALANLLETARELQPQVNRLSEAWLRLPDDLFVNLSLTRQELWCECAATGCLLGMLEANSRETFSNAYFGLLVSLDLRDRLVANRIFADWSKRLFGAAVSSPVTPESEVGTDPAQHRPRRRYERGEDPFKRTLRQIDGILQVVSEGHDAIALRYLRELLDYQRDQPDLAVKSLCNLAQQCKELYRSDFERTCLDEALALRPFDPYVLVQFGDHLKRAGQFDDAREALGRAVTVASPQGRVVAQASLAHSYALEREYETAERMFREIPNWERDVSIRTALADLWRVTGRTVHAEAAYQEILREWPDQSRAVAGLAELAKREGDYLHAIELYQELLARTDMDRRSWVMWRLGLSHVFKLSGQLDDALRLVDEVVQEAPFNMDARVQRSALFGLLGEPLKGLLPQPVSENTGVEEWLRQYVNGLLLCKLSRFEEARGELIERFQRTVLSTESEHLLRLGAALCFLSSSGLEEAAEQLRLAGPSVGVFEGYVASVLRLHIAVAEREQATVSELLETLERIREADPTTREAIDAIERRDFSTAVVREVDLLLMAA